jgi:hypothetical protein
VDYEYDPGTNFTSLQSYDWFPVPKKNVRYELIIKQIKNEIEKQLESRGFSKVSEAPDFFIALHGGIQQYLSYEDYKYLREHYEPYWAKRRIDFAQYDEDTVIIDFIDTKTKSLFYRGSVTTFIMEPTAEKRTEIIHEAVTKTLDNYQILQSK